MSATMQTTPDRRQHNHHLVSELQQERRQVWSLYCKVADLKPFPSLVETKSIVTEFSQLLIDYISLGHFGIYEYLLSGKERRGKVLTAAKNIYPDFSKTTEVAMSFNDKYDDSLKHKFKTDELEADLSALGESLAKRIELEDDLCRLVLK
jgi:regulator of sigma D